MDDYINKLIEQNVFDEVESSVYDSPCFLVTNPDKTKRFVVAYTHVNAKIKVYAYPDPNLELPLLVWRKLNCISVQISVRLFSSVRWMMIV